jgi:hypothetical protein
MHPPNFFSVSQFFNAKPASAYTIQSSPQERRSDNKAAPRRPVWNMRYDRRTRCHSARRHPGKRTACRLRGIDRDLLQR